MQLYFTNSETYNFTTNNSIAIVGVFCVEVSVSTEVTQFFLRADSTISILTTPYWYSDARKQWVRCSFKRDASTGLWSRAMFYYLSASGTPVAVDTAVSSNSTNYPTIKIYYNTK